MIDRLRFLPINADCFNGLKIRITEKQRSILGDIFGCVDNISVYRPCAPFFYSNFSSFELLRGDS